MMVSVGRDHTLVASGTTMLILFAFAVAVPLSLSFWILSVLTNRGSNLDEIVQISPVRWLLAFCLPLIIVQRARHKKSLDFSGAVASLVTGFMLIMANYSFLASLLCFFVTSSKATRYKESEKRKFDPDFKVGGQRNWMQVLANGGMATELSLLYIVDVGCIELPIDFRMNYRASWLAIGVLSALCSANGDTWASELGSVCTKQLPRLITNMKVVPRGTNGGVTFIGLLFSALGGTVVGMAYYVTLWLCINSNHYEMSPPQWPILVVATVAGLLGSMVDSLIGATLQYSGINEKTGKIVEVSDKNIKHISGIPLFDNHSVNLISTIITAIVMPRFAMCFWP